MSRWDPDAKGRLAEAALELFSEQGYDRTTVADIAARAGLTERTFFRHYGDKREVLFGGDFLVHRMVDRLEQVPLDVSPMEAVTVVIEDACAFTSDSRPEWSRKRAGIVAAHPDLQERELAKMTKIAEVLAESLRERGVTPEIAELVTEVGVLAYRVAYQRWAAGPPSQRAAPMVRVVLDELRTAVVE